MEGLPVSVPPSPFVQSHCLSILNRGPRILACMSLSVPRFWLHQLSWALWNLIVRWPVSWIVPENELVGRMFFDVQTLPKKQNLLGVPILMPQQLDIYQLPQRGLIRMTTLHQVKNCFWKQGDHMIVFWQPQRNAQACLSTLQMEEPKQWPVQKLPIGPMRTVRKQCVSFLEMCGPSQNPTACQAQDNRPCVGPDFPGTQDSWIPLVDQSDVQNLKVAILTHDSVSLANIDLSTGFTEFISRRPWKTKTNLKFFCNTVISMDGLQMTLAQDRFFNKIRYHIVMFQMDGFIAHTHSFFSSMDTHSQMSLCEKDTESFLIAQKNSQGLFLVVEKSWFFLMDCMRQDNPAIDVIVHP